MDDKLMIKMQVLLDTIMEHKMPVEQKLQLVRDIKGAMGKRGDYGFSGNGQKN